MRGNDDIIIKQAEEGSAVVISDRDKSFIQLTCTFINKLKTTFNSFLTEWFYIQEEFTTPFEEISPQQRNKNVFKSFICQQENATAVQSLRAKIVIVGNSK